MEASNNQTTTVSNKSNNTTLIILIVSWAVSMPLMLLIQILFRLVLGDMSLGILRVIINLFSFLLGLWFLLGWLPIVILLVNRNKK